MTNKYGLIRKVPKNTLLMIKTLGHHIIRILPSRLKILRNRPETPRAMFNREEDNKMLYRVHHSRLLGWTIINLPMSWSMISSKAMMRMRWGTSNSNKPSSIRIHLPTLGALQKFKRRECCKIRRRCTGCGKARKCSSWMEGSRPESTCGSQFWHSFWLIC